MPPGGGVWIWKPLSGAPLAPLSESISAGSLPALNLLFDPRAVRFGMPHYQVALQHGAQLGSRSGARARQWCWEWIGPLSWPCPDPFTIPGCQCSYECLIPNSRSVKAAAVAANVAKPAAQSAPMASAGAPIEAPSAASHFRDAMEAVQAVGTSGSFDVWCWLALPHF